MLGPHWVSYKEKVLEEESGVKNITVESVIKAAVGEAVRIFLPSKLRLFGALKNNNNEK